MPPSRQSAGILLLLLTLICFALFHAIACSRQEGPERLEKISLAVTPWPGSMPLYVALEKGFFRGEGLDADLRSYASGRLALEAALSGREDLATATDTPIARAAVNGRALAVIATLAEVDQSIQIVARRDRGISAPGDLKGKRIGLDLRSSAEYFLHIYLAALHISTQEVRIVDLTPERTVDALLNGAVDAVSTWPPYTSMLRDKLGDKALFLHDPNIYRMTWNLAGSRDYVEKNPERMKRILRALLRAESYAEAHPEESRALSSGYIGTRGPFYEQEWVNFHFTLTLDQSLILNLEDQARWIMRREGRSSRKLPNFLDFIYTDGLGSVQPGSVRIVGK